MAQAVACELLAADFAMRLAAEGFPDVATAMAPALTAVALQAASGPPLPAATMSSDVLHVTRSILEVCACTAFAFLGNLFSKSVAPNMQV